MDAREVLRKSGDGSETERDELVMVRATVLAARALPAVV